LARLHVLGTDARHLLRRLAQRRQGVAGENTEAMLEDIPESLRDFLEPDVVYLDPMFPGAKDRTAAAKKPLRVLRALVGEDPDQEELWYWAMRVARRRVVVKRPARAAALGGAEGKPTMNIEGKGFRLDVYVVKKNF